MKSCKEISRLVSESQDRPLSLMEKMSLRVHTFICGNCKNFEKNISFLQSAVKEFSKKDIKDRDD
ncbi:MAG: zf-HC2 domain-containing protein [Cellvibrionaceae bacterium]